MNVLLWVCQAVLALLSVAGGATKVFKLDDLAMQSTTDVRDADGEPLLVDGTPLVYDAGDLPLDGPNLRDFVRAAAITVGHFQGEGHCDYARR